MIWIHSEATFSALGLAGTDSTVFTMRAAVAVEQQPDLISHAHAAFRAFRVQVFKLPVSPALWAMVVWNDHDVTMDDVPMWS